VREVCARESVEGILLDDELKGLAAELPSDVARIACWREGETPLYELQDGAPRTLPRAPARLGSIVLLTSGTTGTPKGAPQQQTRFLVVVGGCSVDAAVDEAGSGYGRQWRSQRSVNSSIEGAGAPQGVWTSSAASTRPAASTPWTASYRLEMVTLAAGSARVGRPRAQFARSERTLLGLRVEVTWNNQLTEKRP